MMNVKGMGHDMPRAMWAELIDGIVENAERAGDPPDRHPPSPAHRSSLSSLPG